MVSASSSKDYWVLRLAQAVENALAASTERSRTAYLELARHYWSMHVMIHGDDRLADLTLDQLEALALARPNPKENSQLQCAA